MTKYLIKILLPSSQKVHIWNQSVTCLQDISSEHPERFFVAEIVREKIFMQYRNEVPYACQVIYFWNSYGNSRFLYILENIILFVHWIFFTTGQVNVISYKSRPTAKDFIQVEIVVEKNSQKIILIGKVIVSILIHTYILFRWISVRCRSSILTLRLHFHYWSSYAIKIACVCQRKLWDSSTERWVWWKH